MFIYIISKSKGLCGSVACVMFAWLIGGGLLGVWYGVGFVCLMTWRLLERRAMWGLCGGCVMVVVFCACCWTKCREDVFCPVCNEMVVLCVGVCGFVVCEVGL